METTDKVIRAKERLLQRFRKQAPRSADRGERLPPGQRVTRGFPVLDLGIHPRFDPETWRLTVSGEVAQPLSLNWDEFRALPRREQRSDFHCVTTWSAYDLHWGGVPFEALLERAQPTDRARFVMLYSADDYTTNLPLDELLHDDVLLADELAGEALSTEHGGPLRLLVPHLYGWKSAKWLTGIGFRETDAPGFWEERGYHDRGDPWSEERYR